MEASWAIATGVLSGKGYHRGLFDAATLWSILGGALYLGLVSVFALGIGTIIKASAGGISAWSAKFSISSSFSSLSM